MLLALVLWVIVSLREPTEDVLPAQLVPLLGSGVELEGPPPPVRVLVRALGRDMLKLYRTPPVIRRRIPPNAPNVVTLELTPANVSLPPGIDATVEDVIPRTVTVRLRRAPGVVRPPLVAEEADVVPALDTLPIVPGDTTRALQDTLGAPQRDSLPLPPPPDSLRRLP